MLRLERVEIWNYVSNVKYKALTLCKYGPDGYFRTIFTLRISRKKPISEQRDKQLLSF
jgi:hypothetical protein